MKRITAFLAAIVSLVISSAVRAQSESTPTTGSDDPPDSISSFIGCLNKLGLTGGNIDQTVACIPANCRVTVTLSTASAQKACTPMIPPPLGTVGPPTLFQFPRVIFDCDGPADALRFRPSYTLCPVGSKDATGQLGINRIEIGRDITPIMFSGAGGEEGNKMRMADVPVKPGTNFTALKFENVLSTGVHSHGCKGCHGAVPPVPGPTSTAPNLIKPLNPFGPTSPATGPAVEGLGAVIYSNSAAAPMQTLFPRPPWIKTNLLTLCDTINSNINMAAITQFYATNAMADTSRLFLLCTALALKFPGTEEVPEE
jgi:hypothetical protein